MRFTAINTNIGIESERILNKIKKGECKLNLDIVAYIGEEDYDRHITLNICPEIEPNGFDIWLDFDIYQAELLSIKIQQLVSNRKAFLKNKMQE